MKKKKVVFIAHPVGGDIERNVKKVHAICELVHKSDVIPVAPIPWFSAIFRRYDC